MFAFRNHGKYKYELSSPFLVLPVCALLLVRKRDKEIILLFVPYPCLPFNVLQSLKPFCYCVCKCSAQKSIAVAVFECHHIGIVFMFRPFYYRKFHVSAFLNKTPHLLKTSIHLSRSRNTQAHNQALSRSCLFQGLDSMYLCCQRT